MPDDPTAPKRVSPRGRELLAEWEGIRLEEYSDAAGLPTIGVGHLIASSEVRSGMLRIGDRHVSYSAGISREDALELFAQDLETFEQAVQRAVLVPLEQHQFDALTSFAFNVGIGNLRASTLLKVVNAGDVGSAPAQFRRWVNAGGKRIPGLVRRRENEIALWEGRYAKEKGANARSG